MSTTNILDLNNRIDELEKNSGGDTSALANKSDIATEFSIETSYTAGNFVYYEGKLYIFNVDHAAGAWDATDVAEANVTDEITSNKAAIDALTASEIAYDNTDSELSATKVQGAIDEVVGDVSTLSNRVDAHTFGTAVSVATYTSSNKYTCPSDGYIRWETSGTSPSANIYMNGKMYGYVTAAAAGNIYVKKGAQIHCSNVNNTTIEFIPIS